MDKIILVGAGQLGSRHLQGLLKMRNSIEITVFDPSEQSLLVAKQRAEEINHLHSLIFTSNVEDFPKIANLAVIATNADVREKAIIGLLDNTDVKFMILEKVLFQEIDAYDRIETLFNNRGITAWVNHPRRIYKHYIELKKLLDKQNGPFVFSLYGDNWGLGCNGLHFLDLFCFLTNSQLASISNIYIDSSIQDSKRPGFIEFTGTLTGKLTDGSQFSVSSLQGTFSCITMTIQTNNGVIVVTEKDKHNIVIIQDNNCKSIAQCITEFQSDNTGNVAQQIISHNESDLTGFSEAKKCHIMFIDSLLHKYNQILKKQSLICPIT